MKYFSKYYTNSNYTKFWFSLESKAELGFQAQHFDNSLDGQTWFHFTARIHKPKKFTDSNVKLFINKLSPELEKIKHGNFTWTTQYKGPNAKAMDSLTGTSSNYDSAQRSEKIVTLTFNLTSEDLMLIRKMNEIKISLTTGTETMEYKFNTLNSLQVKAMCHKFLDEKIPTSLNTELKKAHSLFDKRRILFYGIGYILPFLGFFFSRDIDSYLTDTFNSNLDFKEYIAMYCLASIALTTSLILPLRKYLFK